MGKATNKMIAFSQVISNELGIEIPKEYEYDFEYISTFIDNHRQDYSIRFEDEIGKYAYECLSNNYKKLGYVIKYDNLKFVRKLTKGIYIFWNNKKLLYIGKSIDLKSRVISSLRERNNKRHPITHISVIELKTEAEVHILEPILITTYKPMLNTEFKCEDVCYSFKSYCNINNFRKYEIAVREEKEIGRKKNVYKENNRK